MDVQDNPSMDVPDRPLVAIRHLNRVGEARLPQRFVVDMRQEQDRIDSPHLLSSPAEDKATGHGDLVTVSGVLLPQPTSPPETYESLVDVCRKYTPPKLRSDTQKTTDHSSRLPASDNSTNLSNAVGEQFMRQFPNGIRIKHSDDVLAKLTAAYDAMWTDEARLSIIGDGKYTVPLSWTQFIAEHYDMACQLGRTFDVEEMFYEGDLTGALRIGPIHTANAFANLQPSPFTRETLPALFWAHSFAEKLGVPADIQTWERKNTYEIQSKERPQLKRKQSATNEPQPTATVDQEGKPIEVPKLRTTKTVEIKRPTALKSEDMEKGHKAVRLEISAGRHVYLEVEVVPSKSSGGAMPPPSTATGSSTAVANVLLPGLGKKMYRAGLYSYKVNGLGVKSDRSPVKVPEPYLLGQLQVICELHSASARFGALHNWKSTEIFYLESPDCVSIPRILEEDEGSQRHGFTFVDLLVCLARYEEDASDDVFVGSLRARRTVTTTDDATSSQDHGTTDNARTDSNSQSARNPGPSTDGGSGVGAGPPAYTMRNHTPYSGTGQSGYPSGFGQSRKPELKPTHLNWPANLGKDKEVFDDAPQVNTLSKKTSLSTLPPYRISEETLPDFATIPAGAIEISSNNMFKVFRGRMLARVLPTAVEVGYIASTPSGSGSPVSATFSFDVDHRMVEEDANFGFTGTTSIDIDVIFKLLFERDHRDPFDLTGHAQLARTLIQNETAAYIGPLRPLQGRAVPILHTIIDNPDAKGLVLDMLGNGLDEEMSPGVTEDDWSGLAYADKKRIVALYRAIHSVKVCHGDVALRHIRRCVDMPDQLKLIDFDLAQFVTPFMDVYQQEEVRQAIAAEKNKVIELLRWRQPW